MNNEIAKLSEGVSVEKMNEVQGVLNSIFDGVQKMRNQLDAVVVYDPSDKTNMKLANTIRLGVRQVRLEAEKTFDAKRAEVQQQMLAYKTEDQLWLKAKQTMQILTKEIEEQARWKEETKERFEKEQQELKIQQRTAKLSIVAPYVSRSEFENMSDVSFEVFYAGLEKTYNEKIEAEKKAEAERLAKIEAEKIERENIRLENERLKAEAIEKERLAKIEREAEQKKQAEILAKQKAESDRLAKIEREKQAKIQSELRAKAEAERIEREKIEKELRAKAEAERLAKIEREKIETERIESERKKQNAPDKEKLQKLAVDIENFQLPEVVGEDAKKIIFDIQVLLQKTSKFIHQKIEKI